MCKLEFQIFLENEYKNIKRRNTRYSKAAFAEKIGISPTHLSQLLNDKRALTHSVLAKIDKACRLSAEQKNKILHQIDFKNNLKTRGKEETITESYKLSNYEMSLVCSWEHMAILSLAEIPNNSYESRWIADRLNLGIERVSEILECLLKLHLIKINGNNFILGSGHVKTTDNIPSSYIRKYHRDAILNTVEKIDKIPIEERVFSALTLAFDSTDIGKVKKAVNSFKDKIGNLSKRAKKYDRVYQLSIQYIPLDIKDKL